MLAGWNYPSKERNRTERVARRNPRSYAGFSPVSANVFLLLLQLKVPMADKPGSTVNFRKLLLNRCQKEFEKDKADDDVFEKKQKELEAATTVSGIFPP